MPRSIRRRSIRPFSSAARFLPGRSPRPSIFLSGPLSLSPRNLSSVVYNSGSQAHVGRVSGVRTPFVYARVREGASGSERTRGEKERDRLTRMYPPPSLPTPPRRLSYRFPIPSAVSSHLPPLCPSDSFLSVLPSCQYKSRWLNVFLRDSSPRTAEYF